MAKAVTLSDLNENLIIQNKETEHVALETEKVKVKIDDLSKNIHYLTETMILIQKEKDVEKQRAKARSGGKKKDSEGFFGGFGLGALAATLTKMVGSFGVALIGSVGVMFSTVINDIAHVLAAPLVLKPIAMLFDKIAVFSIRFAKYGERMFNAIGKVGNFFFKAQEFFEKTIKILTPSAKFLAELPQFIQPLVGFFKMLGTVFKFLGVILIIWDTVSTAMKGWEKGGFVGAITGAVGGFLGSVVGSIMDLFKSIGAFVLDLIGLDTVADALRSFSFQELIERAFIWLGSDELWGVIGDSLQAAMVVPFQKMFSNMSDKLFDWGQLIKDTVLEIWDVIKSYFTNIGDKISKAASNVGTSVMDFFTGGDKKSFKEVRAEAGGTGKVSDPFSESTAPQRLAIPQSKTQNPDKPYVFDSYEEATATGSLFRAASPSLYSGFNLDETDDGKWQLTMVPNDAKFFKDGGTLRPGVLGVVGEGRDGIPGTDDDQAEYVRTSQPINVMNKKQATGLYDSLTKTHVDPLTGTAFLPGVGRLNRHVFAGGQADKLTGFDGKEILKAVKYGMNGTVIEQVNAGGQKYMKGAASRALKDDGRGRGLGEEQFLQVGSGFAQMSGMGGYYDKMMSGVSPFPGQFMKVNDQLTDTSTFYNPRDPAYNSGMMQFQKEMYGILSETSSRIDGLIAEGKSQEIGQRGVPIIVNNTTANTTTANQGFSVKANPWDSRDPFAGYH